MSRGITENDVWQAADALLLEGARPTIERVRQKIGRGSPNTVSPHLDAWFSRLGARLQGSPASGSAFPALPEGVRQAAQQFWDTAMDSARTELQQAFTRQSEALEAQRQQLVEEQEQMRAQAERLSARQQGLEEALATLRSRLEEAAHERQRLEAQLQAQQAEAHVLRAEASASRELAQQLAAQLDGQRHAHEAERQRLEERATAHEKRWALELDRTRDALKQQQARLVAAETEAARKLSQLGGERERLEGELQVARAAAARLAHESDTWKLQLQQTRQMLDELRESAARRDQERLEQQQLLQSRLDEASTQLKAREEEHAALLRSLAEAGLRRRTRRRHAPAE